MKNGIEKYGIATPAATTKNINIARFIFEPPCALSFGRFCF